MTQAQIGSAVRCSQALIHAIKKRERGGRLSYGVGERLIALWRERCASGDPAATFPTRPVGSQEEAA